MIVYNTAKLKPNQAPSGVTDLLHPKWKDRCAIANPLFGTTAPQAAALFALWGESKAKRFFLDLKANRTAILPGNAVVKDMVAAGELAAGMTDTDDVNMAFLAGKPEGMILPDQNSIGALLIPNTVCLLKNSPNPSAGKQLIDYLFSTAVEKNLAFSPSAQILVRPSVAKPPNTPSIDAVKTMALSYEAIANQTENAA